MRPFGSRRTDFGHSELPAPEGTRWIDVKVAGAIWRVELDEWEEATPELATELETQAHEWSGVGQIILDVADRPRG